MAQHDHSDTPFRTDMAVMLERRRLLSLAGLTASGILLGGCRGGPGGPPPGDSEPNRIVQGPNGTTCIKDPKETNGPYPADGTNTKSGATVNALTQNGVVRPDIRSSFGGMSGTADGVEVNLVIHLVDVNNGCAPLANHAIYIWQCDAAGQYSLYNLTDQNYLRGVGVTDATGVVTFKTIFPGCYDGRWPHIHFEVFRSLAEANSGDKSLLISQFAMPEANCKQVYGKVAGYEDSVDNFAGVTLTDDNVFGDNTPEQIKAQTLVMAGSDVGGKPVFKAEVTVGLV